MQVMTGIHSDKYDNWRQAGGLDPVTNLRVGVKVLQECIQRAGSVPPGLKFYVGAAHLADDGGYAEKVMAEHARLRLGWPPAAWCPWRLRRRPRRPCAPARPALPAAEGRRAASGWDRADHPDPPTPAPSPWEGGRACGKLWAARDWR